MNYTSYLLSFWNVYPFPFILEVLKSGAKYDLKKCVFIFKYLYQTCHNTHFKYVGFVNTQSMISPQYNNNNIYRQIVKKLMNVIVQLPRSLQCGPGIDPPPDTEAVNVYRYARAPIDIAIL